MRIKKNSVKPFLEIHRKALKVKFQNKVALRQVVRKQVSFRDRKKGNKPKFPRIEI